MAKKFFFEPGIILILRTTSSSNASKPYTSAAVAFDQKRGNPAMINAAHIAPVAEESLGQLIRDKSLCTILNTRRTDNAHVMAENKFER